MAQVIHSTEEVAPREEIVVRKDPNVLQRIVYFVFAAIEALLILRLLLALFGANKNNTFANTVYSLSDPFVQPFVGLFSITPNVGVVRFEIETLTAIFIVALLGWILSMLFAIGRSREGRI